MTPSPYTVLVVEDYPAMRPLLCQVLAQCPCRVLVAASSAEAIATIEQQDGPVHLLLVDLNQPDMSGPVLTALVRALCPGVRALHLCGSCLTVQCKGDDDLCLPKPFRVSDLVDKVLELLRGSEPKVMAERCDSAT
jgi:CheY-like chemotaxis protein